jgi:hypothetical protein
MLKYFEKYPLVDGMDQLETVQISFECEQLYWRCVFFKLQFFVQKAFSGVKLIIKLGISKISPLCRDS